MDKYQGYKERLRSLWCRRGYTSELARREDQPYQKGKFNLKLYGQINEAIKEQIIR